MLVRIGTAEAEQSLIGSLLQADVTLRHRVIASLNKLRTLHPEVNLDPSTINLLLAAEIAGHYRSYQVLGPLKERLKDEDPVLQAMRHAMDQELDRIFRLMALLLPHVGLHDAYVGLRSSDELVRANSLELLDNVLDPELRQLLVPLLDAQVSTDERIAIANRLVGAPLDTAEQAVETLLSSEDPWLRSSAIYAVGALQLRVARGRAEQVRQRCGSGAEAERARRAPPAEGRDGDAGGAGAHAGRDGAWRRDRVAAAGTLKVDCPRGHSTLNVPLECPRLQFWHRWQAALVLGRADHAFQAQRERG